MQGLGLSDEACTARGEGADPVAIQAAGQVHAGRADRKR